MTTTSGPRLNAEQRRRLQRVLPLALVVVGVAVFVVGWSVGTHGAGDSVVVSTNPAIDEVIPAPGAEVLRQSRVGIDLAPGYTAELTINGVPIPNDQLNLLRDPDDPGVSAPGSSSFDTSLNQFLFQPFDGRAIEALKPDENCVLAVYWPLADPTDRNTVDWCFTVS